MTKIQVPEDAESILDEIIELARQVEANNNYYREYPDVGGHEEETKFNQDFDELKNSVDVLCYRWCEMDPLQYSCNCPIDSSDTSLFFGRFDMIDFNDMLVFNVPNEIYTIVSKYSESDGPINKYVFPLEVRQQLSMLREKVIIQTRLASKSSNSENSRDENRKDRDKSSEPKLINDSRTVRIGIDEHTFTAQQSIIVKIMWEKGIHSPDFWSEQTILEEAKLQSSSFVSLFRSRRDEFKAVFEQHDSKSDLWRICLGQTAD